MNQEDDVEELPQPLDLPSLSSKPSFSTLLSILKRLTPDPPSWSDLRFDPPYNYIPWLIRLIATPLPWLTSAELETIVSMASNNIALRAGRTAAPDMTRTFVIDGHKILLFEPSWTGDSIGHKTWGSSLILASRLSSLHTWSTSPCLLPSSQRQCLSLGEGTGLLGISATKVMAWTVTLTDLPDITQNLRRNVESNCHERVEVKDLDWINPPEESEIVPNSFDVVIGSDLFYDPHHPRLVVAMLERYLRRDEEARAVIAYPMRTSHLADIHDFEQRIEESFIIEHAKEEISMDDWDIEVRCKWAIYKWKDNKW